MNNLYIAISEADIRDEATAGPYSVFTTQEEAAADCFANGDGPPDFVVFRLVPVADYTVEDQPKLVWVKR